MNVTQPRVEPARDGLPACPASASFAPRGTGLKYVGHSSPCLRTQSTSRRGYSQPSFSSRCNPPIRVTAAAQLNPCSTKACDKSKAITPCGLRRNEPPGVPEVPQALIPTRHRRNSRENEVSCAVMQTQRRTNSTHAMPSGQQPRKQFTAPGKKASVNPHVCMLDIGVIGGIAATRGL